MAKNQDEKNSEMNKDKETKQSGLIVKCVLDENVTSFGNMQDSSAIGYASQKENLQVAEELDKTDLFDHLLIDVNDYKFQEHLLSDGKRNFGIQKNKDIHLGNSVILKYQEYAVKQFLGNFRGIGILADEVGMGKTFEAGMIISELAERRLAKSILIVAAHENNLVDWNKVLVDNFGFEGLKRVRGYNDISSNYDNDKDVALVPMIMTFEDYCKLPSVNVGRLLFDIIVIDEAHNFGEMEIGKDGMKVLTEQMKTKKQKGKPYCILISATPHKGNLDSMFPLWYFIKGTGDIEKDRTHYREFLCHGATTIAEFIESFRIEELSTNEKYINFRKAKEQALKNIAPENYRSMMDVAEASHRWEFLSSEDNAELRESIRNTTRKAYLNLLNSFMIRQSRTVSNRVAEKQALNYYFVQIEKDKVDQTVKFKNQIINKSGVGEIDFDCDCTNFYSDKAITYNNKKMSIDEFAKEIVKSDEKRRNENLQMVRTDIIFSALGKLGAFSVKSVRDGYNNRVAGERFFKTTLNKYDRQIKDCIEVVDDKRTLFEEKVDKFVELLSSSQRENRRAIVFFDYYTNSKRNEGSKLAEYLKENYPEFYKRIIIEDNGDVGAEKFKNSTNGIFLAPEEMSESANFQFCDLVVNFSICHSPIKMDQRIGRVDRIGQTSDNIEIISLASMNTLEGYLLAFFNRINLFSGWKDDIILVTGCDNKNALTLKCKNCGRKVRIYHADEEKYTSCEACGDTMLKVENSTNFFCEKDGCTESYEQTKEEKNNQWSFHCNLGEKKKYTNGLNKAGELFSFCDKICLVSRCKKQVDDKGNDLCAAVKLYKQKRTKNILPNINELINECRKCSTPICDGCRMDISAIGYSLANSKDKKCQTSCINIESFNKGKYSTCTYAPECAFLQDHYKPVCRIHREPMTPRLPTTFDEFAKELWETSENRFVEDFSTEIEKVLKIVETLGRLNEEEGV